MAQRGGEGVFGVASDEVPVAVANAGGLHSNQDFAFLRRLEVESFDLNWRIDLFENGGADFHAKRLLEQSLYFFLDSRRSKTATRSLLGLNIRTSNVFSTALDAGTGASTQKYRT